MSVLTVHGTALPEPGLSSLSYHHSSTVQTPSNSARPHNNSAAPLYSYSRPERTSYVQTNPAALPQPPHKSKHSRNSSSPSTYSSSFSPQTASPQRNSQMYTSPLTHSRQSSTSTNQPTTTMHRQSTSGSTSSVPRRSTSSRSTGTSAPTSYVALMRKQKATVWCDRSQHVDPRVAAAQKVARQRATLEITGTNNASGRTSTLNSGGVVGKIRHGGVPKAPGYVPANLSGAGVPMRLSANEMLGDDDEDQASIGDNAMRGARTGSGKSSTNSARYRSGYPRASTTSTPPSGEGSPSREPIPEAGETPGNERNSYFNEKSTSLDSEDSFGDLGDMKGPNSAKRAVEQAEKNEDLRRRGSVDERAMSMGTGVRLFVANPDVED